MKSVLFAAAAALLAIPNLAQSQENCGPYEAVEEHLKEQYSETLRSMGTSPGGTLVLVYASEVTGTWTIVVVDSLQKACLVAAGHNYLIIPTGEPT